jgi:hypothetical protein
MSFVGKVKVIKKGKVVASSKNLEVIDRYRRNNANVDKVIVNKNNLTVKFDDGAYVKTKFADPSVLKSWVANKKKRGLFP